MRTSCSRTTPLCVALLAACAPPAVDPGPAWSSDVVELPATAAGSMRLTDPRSGVSLTARLSGAADVSAERIGDDIVYRAATAEAGDVTFRLRRGGTEDWIGYTRAPRRAAVEYELSLGGGAAGLRFVERTLEVLDAGGAPRLRVSPPFIAGADGRRHDATLAVERCAFDGSAAPPWGRPVTPPGRDTCRLVVDWGGAPVVYPAVLDPVWTTTQDLGNFRSRHGACTLVDGRVLVAAGTSSIGAELFDPITETWAVTGVPPFPGRTWPVLVALGDGRALLAGGEQNTELSSASVYDPATGTWSAGPDMAIARATPSATTLGDGSVLVAGGISDTFGSPEASAERFDPVSSTWSAAGAMSAGRIRHTVSPLADGRAIAAGGFTGSTGGLITTDIYDPTTNAWTPGPPLGVARGYHVASPLTDGRLFVAGGFDGGDLSAAELLDATASSWTAAPPMPMARSGHTSARLQNGRIVVLGGCIDALGCAAVDTVETFDPIASTWLVTPPLTDGRVFHTHSELLDGRVLVVGGEQGFSIASAELLELFAIGDACSVDGECASGHCAEGVCCGAACSAPCVACLAAKTGLTDGTCGPIPGGRDPDGECDDSGSPACTENGVCDGAGACELYTRARGCEPAPCSAASDCVSGFCDPDDAICCDAACGGECQACTAAKKGGGTDGTCGPVEGKTDPDAECSADPAEDDCAQITLCNGEGACEVASSLCVPFACGDGACLEACDADADCAPGFRCNDGACVESDSSCKDEQTAFDGSGAEYPCAPYLCKAGDCLTACASIDDCVAPSVCDASGKCVPAPPRPAGEDGCSCRNVSSGADGRGVAALLALWFVRSLRSRRRRPARPPR